jgi:hypothetical protein
MQMAIGNPAMEMLPARRNIRGRQGVNCDFMVWFSITQLEQRWNR